MDALSRKLSQFVYEGEREDGKKHDWHHAAMLFDDDPVRRQTLLDLLSKGGAFHVELIEDYELAKKMLRRHMMRYLRRPDLIVVVVRGPNFDAIRLLEVFSSLLCPGTVITLMVDREGGGSSRAEVDQAVRACLDLGADGHLPYEMMNEPEDKVTH